jgi:hypothetical protein
VIVSSVATVVTVSTITNLSTGEIGMLANSPCVQTVIGKWMRYIDARTQMSG